jgi:hypothetical protein
VTLKSIYIVRRGIQKKWAKMANSKTPLSLSRETPSALKFFQGREDLINEEKKQRSGN